MYILSTSHSPFLLKLRGSVGSSAPARPRAVSQPTWVHQGSNPNSARTSNEDIHRASEMSDDSQQRRRRSGGRMSGDHELAHVRRRSSSLSLDLNSLVSNQGNLHPSAVLSQAVSMPSLDAAGPKQAGLQGQRKLSDQQRQQSADEILTQHETRVATTSSASPRQPEQKPAQHSDPISTPVRAPAVASNPGTFVVDRSHPNSERQQDDLSASLTMPRRSSGQHSAAKTASSETTDGASSDTSDLNSTRVIKQSPQRQRQQHTQQESQQPTARKESRTSVGSWISFC